MTTCLHKNTQIVACCPYSVSNNTIWIKCENCLQKSYPSYPETNSPCYCTLIKCLDCEVAFFRKIDLIRVDFCLCEFKQYYKWRDNKICCNLHSTQQNLKITSVPPKDVYQT